VTTIERWRVNDLGTVRCTEAERAAFKRWVIPQGYGRVQIRCHEPALGTLDERLGIIVRRLGGRTTPLPRLTAAERDQYRVKEEIR
jgi:hypothetical protein